MWGTYSSYRSSSWDSLPCVEQWQLYNNSSSSVSLWSNCTALNSTERAGKLLGWLRTWQPGLRHGWPHGYSQQIYQPASPASLAYSWYLLWMSVWYNSLLQWKLYNRYVKNFLTVSFVARTFLLLLLFSLLVAGNNSCWSICPCKYMASVMSSVRTWPC